MSHARTFSRYLGAVGCAACLLVAVPVLAAPNPSGFHVLSSKSTGVKSGQYIEAAVSAAYKHGGTAGNARVYTKAMVPVATSTLRKGALSALGRGVMHPGFQVALIGAGLAYSIADGFIYDESDAVGYDENLASKFNDRDDVYYYSSYSNSAYRSKYIPCLEQVAGYNANSEYYTHELKGDASGTQCLTLRTAPNGSTSNSTSIAVNVSPVLPSGFDAPDPTAYQPVGEPITDEQTLSTIDPHIPPQLYDELWNGGPIPEWKDEITVLGAPASYVQPTGDQGLVPEIADKIGKWGENIAAQFDGVPQPNPEVDNEGMTAQEAQYEEGPAWAEQEVPDFPGVEPEWEVDVIDSLPAFDIGFGSGQCPAPTSVQMPIPAAAPIVIEWQPFCDLAGMLRGVVMAVGMILSLFIVLRVK